MAEVDPYDAEFGPLDDLIDAIEAAEPTNFKGGYDFDMEFGDVNEVLESLDREDASQAQQEEIASVALLRSRVASLEQELQASRTEYSSLKRQHELESGNKLERMRREVEALKAERESAEMEMMDLQQEKLVLKKVISSNEGMSQSQPSPMKSPTAQRSTVQAEGCATTAKPYRWLGRSSVLEYMFSHGQGEIVGKIIQGIEDESEWAVVLSSILSQHPTPEFLKALSITQQVIEGSNGARKGCLTRKNKLILTLMTCLAHEQSRSTALDIIQTLVDCTQPDRLVYFLPLITDPSFRKLLALGTHLVDQQCALSITRALIQVPGFSFDALHCVENGFSVLEWVYKAFSRTPRTPDETVPLLQVKIAALQLIIGILWDTTTDTFNPGTFLTKCRPESDPSMSSGGEYLIIPRIFVMLTAEFDQLQIGNDAHIDLQSRLIGLSLALLEDLIPHVDFHPQVHPSSHVIYMLLNSLMFRKLHPKVDELSELAFFVYKLLEKSLAINS